MDDADRSDEQVEAFTRSAIAHKAPTGPAFTGLCANCEGEINYPQRWCCGECFQDWSKRDRRARNA